jgi:hypothetical protein
VSALSLRHDRLCAVGGPHHGEALPIARNSDALLTAQPEPLDWSTLDEPPLYPSRMHTTTYRRIRIAVEGQRWTCDLLIADGYRLHRVEPTMLAEAVAAAVVSACQGGAAILSQRFPRTPQLSDCIIYEVDGTSHHGTPPNYRCDVSSGPVLSWDTWSQADYADVCWRCDAVPGTTDVGLCDACLVDLQAAA